MNIFEQVLGRNRRSARQAKDRMRLILTHDRTNLSGRMFEQLKDEILGVISRHVEIDTSAVRIEMTQEGRQHRLIADIPLKPSDRRRIG